MAIDNPFALPRLNEPINPAVDGPLIVPNDTTDLPRVARMIYVGVGGDVYVDYLNGTKNVPHKNAQSGTYLGPFAVSRVYATGTTASFLLAYI